MTKEKLSALQSLRREVERTKKRIRKIEDTNSASPRSKAALKRLEESLEKYLEEISVESAKIMDFINGIEDATMREIFMLRYFDNMRSWQKIAFELGEYDESYVRKKHDAYLKKRKL